MIYLVKSPRIASFKPVSFVQNIDRDTLALCEASFETTEDKDGFATIDRFGLRSMNLTLNRFKASNQISVTCQGISQVAYPKLWQ